MNQHLILVKHSLPDIEDDLPAREWRLSPEGKLRAERLAERLNSYQPEVLISSDEPKAMETAKILGGKMGLSVVVGEDLHEHERSNLPLLSREKFEESIQKFFAAPDTLVFGNETATEAHERFSNAVRSILRIHKDKTVLIVSHGTVISLFMSQLTGTSAFSFWKELGLPSFVVLDLESNTLSTRENIA